MGYTKTTNQNDVAQQVPLLVQELCEAPPFAVEACRERIARAVLPLVAWHVDETFALRADPRRDECISAGNLALAQAIDKIDRIVDPNKALAFMTTAIIRAIQDETRNVGFGPKVRTRRKQSKAGDTSNAPDLTYMPAAHLTGPVVDNPFALIETVDELKACCTCSNDRDILDRLIEGYTVKQISKDLSIDLKAVYRHITNIRAEYARRDAE